MTFSAWLLDILTALMLVVTAVSATRLATARPSALPDRRLSPTEPTTLRSPANGSGEADTDIAHLLMGIAMAGMLAPSVKTLPPYVWEMIFGLLAARFAWRLVSDTKVNGFRSLVSGHRAVHLFHCAGMVYMLVALTTPEGMDICAADREVALTYPALTRAFALLLVGYGVWDLFGQLSGRRHPPGSTPSTSAAQIGGAAPTVVCRSVMGLTMTFMLLYPMS